MDKITPKKIVLLSPFFGLLFFSGCCFPGDSFVPAQINGCVFDKNNMPIENERIQICWPFFNRTETIDVFTDKDGAFTQEIANSQPVCVCFIPPMAIPAVKTTFSLSFPDKKENKEFWITYPLAPLGRHVLKDITTESFIISCVVDDIKKDEYSAKRKIELIIINKQ